jgi:hypothetical protein
MVPEVFAHRVSIESIDEGSAVARLEPAGHIGPDGCPLEPEAVLVLAQHSSYAAVKGAVRSIHGLVRATPVRSEVTHLREASGPVSAAALVDGNFTSELADDIRRSGHASASVSVAVVDDEGKTVALGAFKFDVAHP